MSETLEVELGEGEAIIIRGRDQRELFRGRVFNGKLSIGTTESPSCYASVIHAREIHAGLLEYKRLTGRDLGLS